MSSEKKKPIDWPDIAVRTAIDFIIGVLLIFIDRSIG